MQHPSTLGMGPRWGEQGHGHVHVSAATGLPWTFCAAHTPSAASVANGVEVTIF